MGYTTKFTGSIKLSRPLTFAEAKTLLEYGEEPDTIPRPNPGSYMQWAPSRTLDAIGWDGGENFYEYTGWLQWLVTWLADRGIQCSGSIEWAGESVGDHGVLTASGGVVTAVSNSPGAYSFRPITLRDLADIALENATKETTE